jgi:hypothetical protein
VDSALVAVVLKTGLIVWLVLLMAIVIGRVLTGRMSSRGLLAEDAAHAGSETSPTRAVSMLVFPLVVLLLVLDALQFDPSLVLPGTRPSFPNISDNLVLLLTGGNGIYLAGKLSSPRDGVVK